VNIGLGGGPQRFEPVGADILASQHRKNARCCPRLFGQDAFDQGMRVRRAQHDCVSQILKREIVEIPSVTGNKTRVLAPLGSIADH